VAGPKRLAGTPFVRAGDHEVAECAARKIVDTVRPWLAAHGELYAGDAVRKQYLENVEKGRPADYRPVVVPGG
jgi:hypothetical protein